MPRPDYLICLECESEVEDFTWREGEVRRAACEVCGNTDADAFALPEDYDEGLDDEDVEEEDLDEDVEEDVLDEYEPDDDEEED